MKTPPMHLALGRAVLLATLVTACLDDRPTAPAAVDASIPVRLGLQANVIGGAAGQTVRIRTFYHRVDGSEVTLESTPTEVGVTPGASQTVAVQVRVARCLADEQRESGDARTCEIGVDLSLVDEGGTVIDQHRTPPSQPATPGANVTIAQPITLASVGDVSIDDSPTLRVSDTHTLTARAADANGNALTRTFTWSSSNPNVLTVDATTGVATALAVGSTNVTATTGLKSAMIALRVISRVTSITLAPDPAPALRAATTLTFTATARDADGADAGNLTDRTVIWSVTNPAGSPETATVSPTGIVTGVYPGDADVTVSIDGVSKTTRVRVIAGDIRTTPSVGQLLVGTTLPFEATAVDANGVALTGVPLSWSSSDNRVATVSNDGVVTAVASGQATITVTGGGASTTVPITVGTLALVVSPNGTSMLAGNTLQLAASGALGTVDWQTSNATIATVSSSGVVTALYPGRVTINATVTTAGGTQRGSATIDVEAARLRIQPSNATIYELETFQFTATAFDTKGVPLTGLHIGWSSSEPQIAPINANGVVYAETYSEGGPITITAFAGGRTATASLEILPYYSGFVTAPLPGARRVPTPATGKPRGN